MEGLLRLFFRSMLLDPAHERSMQLLRANLTPCQLRQFETCSYFDVVGGTTGHIYRIHRGEARNIDEQDDAGAWIYTWCFLPMGRLAEGDVLLAQKVALESFELEARAVGVRTSKPSPPSSIFFNFGRTSRP